MQSAKNWCTDHGARIPRLNHPRLRCILAQAEVRSRLVVVGDVLPQHPPQMPLTEHYHVVEALTPNRSNDSFDVTVLPRRLVGDDLVLNAEQSQRLDDLLAVDAARSRITYRGAVSKGKAWISCRLVTRWSAGQ